MRQRRRRPALSDVLAQDPGKDLFAYLFLLIMVFSFMLLMSFEQKEAGAQTGPVEKKNEIAGPDLVSRDRVGRLVKEGETLLIRFGTVVYDPATDFQRLEADGRITEVSGKSGGSRRFLYIEKDNRQMISLFDYLDTFRSFSQQGVTIAFAREAG